MSAKRVFFLRLKFCVPWIKNKSVWNNVLLPQVTLFWSFLSSNVKYSCYIMLYWQIFEYEKVIILCVSAVLIHDRPNMPLKENLTSEIMTDRHPTRHSKSIFWAIATTATRIRKFLAGVCPGLIYNSFIIFCMNKMRCNPL